MCPAPEAYSEPSFDKNVVVFRVQFIVAEAERWPNLDMAEDAGSLPRWDHLITTASVCRRCRDDDDDDNEDDDDDDEEDGDDFEDDDDDDYDYDDDVEDDDGDDDGDDDDDILTLTVYTSKRPLTQLRLLNKRRPSLSSSNDA
ncbi:hypothetical protein T265_01689 [Opisthorchis viverrini]|uniref:Uncharacterized protein n=1 Tax=Opisthorchis viverrini TaxID=6198 RepID=A0A074ZYW5_OPIVI|nr:hypothetical protein T265_01689 [Opisthorchis viverrini]KER32261.1 hypothetical protein T265_01689 [Opisthorchis viverrini]